MNDITLPRAELEQALRWADQHGEAVFAGGGMDAVDSMNEWAQAMRDRLAQPEQKAVPWESFLNRYCPWLEQPSKGEHMKLEQLFTAKELVLIDSGEYRPGRAVLDAKLDLWAEIEREACAKVCDEVLSTMFPARVSDCAAAIRARGQDPMPLFDDWPGGFKHD